MTLRARLRKRLVAPVLDQLRQGLSPDRVALALSVALCLAVIPVIGVTTMLCVIAGLALRLNQPVVQVVNYASAPLQLVLLIPFFRIGERLFGDVRHELSLRTIARLVSEQPLVAIRTFWTLTLHGVVAWMLVAVPAAVLLYYVLRPVLRATGRRVSAAPPEALDAS